MLKLMVKMRLRINVSLMLIALWSAVVSAFTMQRQQHQAYYYSYSLLTNLYGHDAHHHHQLQDMEEARRQFESMMGPLLFQNLYNDSNTNMSNVPLTSAARRRRQVEIHLLQSLNNSDDALDELMSLWIHECPCLTASTALVKLMESECSFGSAEETLRKILSDCPAAIWPEPAARLALLLFLQGQYRESQEYTDAVLSAKPWHFEALQLQVLLKLVMSSVDQAGAVVAARAGLPPVQQPRKRAAWIKRAVSQANAQMDAFERQTAAATLLSQPSDSYDYRDSQQQPRPSSAGAWQ